ncbi:outer membrane receptor protein involved in Fe transport [Lacibacter cauensis]|uniref:Outer membrane receptor protein involved in Fe transport n=1 Tax=Lacibacter cauensis TaxID=510947 RepID=A0A562SJ69_9BACT|nr:outer membrane beta-barrel protein [Lacibacter cauensis]TWI81301.1 outer membrane receptor protein involved in Fe transport [Lacibacter cauensis]
MQRNFKGLLLTLFTLVLVAFSATAQTSRLNGRVLNQKNEPVAGASITVNEISKSIAADIEGRFSVNLEQGKKYTLTVTAVGYQTKMVDEVEVKNNIEENVITILLTVAAKEGTEIVIRSTARKENTSGLLSFQRNNTSLSSGLSADFIRRTPDKNTGEVLKRVSGASIQDNKFVIVRGLSDRYNQALINGAQLPSSEPDKKAFSFDVIPSQLIDNIIINKTATPDLTGEFAGGLVQIQTKDVPTKDILSIGINLGYNTQSTFKDFVTNQRETSDWFGFDNGRRNLPEGFLSRNQYAKLGDDAKAEQSKLFRSDVFNERKITAAPIQSYNLTYGKGYKFSNGNSFGFITGLTYRNAQNIYDVNRNINDFVGTVERSFTDHQNRFSTSVGAVANVAFTSRKLKVAFKNLYNQLYDDNYYVRSGKNLLDGQDINFRSSYLNQRSLLSSQLEAEQQLSKSGIKLKLNGNFSYNIKAQPDLRTVSYLRSTGTNNPFSLVTDETGRFFSNLKDFSYGGGGTLTVPFTLADEKQTFKAGGGTLIRIRDFQSRNFRYRLDDNTNSSLLTLPFNEVFKQQYIGNGQFVYADETQNEDKYFGVSIINNGYAMFDNKFSDKIRLVWGARVENFQQFLTTVRSDLKRVIVNTSKWDILPSLNVSYSLKDKQQIRLAGYRTVARPEFREIAPFSFYDYEQNYAVSGDTTLRRSNIWNADLRYEWYPKASEGVSVAVFYKHFADPIELRALAAGSVRRYQFQNAGEAKTYGFEVEVRKGLGFIAPKLDVLNIFTNVTVLSSAVQLSGVGANGQAQSFNRPLQGQSPYLVNVGLQFNDKKGKVNASLLYNRIGQRLALAGGKDQLIYDIYERPRDLVDFQISTKVLKNKGELRLAVSDIFNQPFFFYENIDAKNKFTRGTDRLWNSYTPGTTFTIGFTYDLTK